MSDKRSSSLEARIDESDGWPEVKIEPANIEEEKRYTFSDKVTVVGIVVTVISILVGVVLAL